MSIINKLRGIIKKNFRLLMRSRSSSLIVVLGPLLLVLLVGTAFNTATIQGVRVGVYSETYSQLTEDILEGIRETKFGVIKAESRDLCIEGIKTGTNNLCIVFPTNLNIESSNDITFYVDPSRVNLVYTVMDKIGEKIESTSGEISKELTKNILGKIDEAEMEIKDKKQLISSVSGSLTNAEKNLVNSIQVLEGVDMNYDFDNMGWSEFEATFANTSAIFDGNYGRLKQKVREFSEILENARVAKDTAVRNLNPVRSTTSQSALLVSSLAVSLDLIGKNINDVKIKDADTIVNPLETRIEPVVTAKSNLNYLFPTLLVMLVMFTGLLLSSAVVIKERSTAAYFRNFLTPTQSFLFVAGHFITNFLIIAVQMVIVLGVGYYFFRDALTAVLPNLIGALGIVASMFILTGMFIGYVFKSEETGALASLSTGSVMLFLSNAILPVEALPEFMIKVGLYNPFVLSETLIRRITLFSSSLSAQLTTVYILLGIAAVFLIMSYIGEIRGRRE